MIEQLYLIYFGVLIDTTDQGQTGTGRISMMVYATFPFYSWNRASLLDVVYCFSEHSLKVFFSVKFPTISLTPQLTKEFVTQSTYMCIGLEKFILPCMPIAPEWCPLKTITYKEICLLWL